MDKLLRKGYAEHTHCTYSAQFSLIAFHWPSQRTVSEKTSFLNSNKEMGNFHLPIRTSLFVLFSSSFQATEVSSRS